MRTVVAVSFVAATSIGPRTHRLSPGVAAVSLGRWPGAVARITVTTGA